MKILTSFGKPFLRLCDNAGHPDHPAQIGITAMAVSRARAKHAAGEGDDAKAILRRSISWFPGVDEPGAAVHAVEISNANNNLAYFALSAWGEDLAPNYVAALKRSEALVASELGGPLPGAVDRNVLEADGKAMMDALQDQSIGLQTCESALEAGHPVTLLLSPIVQIRAGVLTVTLPIGPVRFP